ncbi:hypothetical protein PG985_006680 [Apiospora marii]|uniref:Uncharacterized protein n=1 Tax=Apiospora marii TaxID=335849 RepID=A0ABR1S8C0_9PEZI
MDSGKKGSTQGDGDVVFSSKGKGKAVESISQPGETTHGNERPSPDSSAATRILDSAVSLARDVTRNPPGPSDMKYMAPAGKAGRLSGSGSTIPPDVAASGTASSAGHTKPGASFKSAQLDEHIASQEAAFSAFLDGESAQPIISFPTAGRACAEDHLNNNPTVVKTTAMAGQAQADGMDVVKLLDSTDYNSVTEPDEADVTLTSAEAAGLRRALFQNEDSQESRQHHIDWNILNFFPDFLSDGRRRWGYTELPNHMGVTDPIEARDLWVKQWQHVLSDYTDEVWGDLGSLVDEARQEVEEASAREPDATGPPEMPALRRLRQVLNHIRGGS